MKQCKLAEIGLETDTLGFIRTCCVAKPLLDDNGIPYNINKDKLSDVWNSESRKNIISDLRSGIEVSNCETCWQEERSGLTSKRMRDNQRYSEINEVDLPIMFDIKPGNTCNLRCRTCYSGNSSSWVTEEYDLGLLKTKQIINPYRNNSLYWEELSSLLVNAKYIEFYGGEPLLIDNLWDILEGMDLHDVELHINTNCSLYLNDKQLSIIQKAKKTRIVLSIDGIKNHFEYLRYPAKWEDVLKNLNKYNRLISDRIEVTVCCTISCFNIFYINDLINYFSDNYPNIKIFLNYLFYPKKFKITILPEEIKFLLQERIPEDVLSFMNSEPEDTNEFQEFIDSVKKIDKYRKQNFSKIFPEWNEKSGIYSYED